MASYKLDIVLEECLTKLYLMVLQISLINLQINIEIYVKKNYNILWNR